MGSIKCGKGESTSCLRSLYVSCLCFFCPRRRSERVTDIERRALAEKIRQENLRKEKEMLEKLKQEAERLKAEAEAETKQQKETEAADDEDAEAEQESEEETVEEEKKKSPAKRKAPAKKAAKPKTPVKATGAASKKQKGVASKAIAEVTDDVEDDVRTTTGQAVEKPGKGLKAKSEKGAQKKVKEESTDAIDVDQKPSKGKKPLVVSFQFIKS